MNLNKERKKINRVRKKINTKLVINQDIIRISIFFCVLAVALIVYLCVFLLFESDAIINNTYNKRADSFKKTVERGTIYSSDDTVLAYSTQTENGEVRYYPYGNAFSHIVGFESNGGLGLEASYNFYLLTSHVNMFEKISNEFQGKKNPGDSIHTSLNVNLQVYISDILYGLKASAICINPETGEVISVVSKPDFDPNYISIIWDEIIKDEENSPLVNRATQGQYTPGSTFKIFTLAEFIRENPEYANYRYFCEGRIYCDGFTMACSDDFAHGDIGLREAMAYSCNLAFADIGLKLNTNKFAEDNDSLLFNSNLGVDFPYNKAVFQLDNNDSDFMKMQTAFGQGETLTNPLHLAMVMSAIANDGILMKTHVVNYITNTNGTTIKTFNKKVYKELFTSEETATMNEYLRAVVTEGTAYCMAYEDYEAYGKTGTAETNSDKELNIDNSWFVGYACFNNQKLVVCINIEDTTLTPYAAVDYAHMIFNYYFY